MSDITKARAYLKRRESKLLHLESFGLMLSTAETEYRNILRTINKNAVSPGDFDQKQVEAALDYAVLLYLRRHANLPPDIGKAFSPGITKEEKQELARQWIK